MDELPGPGHEAGLGPVRDAPWPRISALEIPQGAAANLIAGGAIGKILESYAKIASPLGISLAEHVSRQLAVAGFAEAISSQLVPLNRVLERYASSVVLDMASRLNSSADWFVRSQAAQLASALDSVNRLAVIEMNGMGSGLLDTVIRYGRAQASIAELTLGEGSPILLGGETVRAGRLYDSYLNGLPARPIERRAAVARRAGNVQTGLVAAESLTAPCLGAGDRNTLAVKLTETVLEPWESGPADARADLFAVLSALEPDLPDWLKAAWDDIVRDGPKAASKVANCTVECIDRALRAAAPNSEVIPWLDGRSLSGEVLRDGKPTRRARVFFVMTGRPKRDVTLAAVQVETLISLIQRVIEDMQSVKHGDAPSIATMRSWLLAAEAALAQLFLQA